MSETRKIAAILVADIVGYSRLAGADEDRILARLQGAAQRPDRSDHRRASWSRRQAHRRRQPHRVPQRGRRGALRDRGAERPHRAQRRPAAGAPHRVPGRHSSGRCRRGGRRRSDGRRRQHRRATGGHRRARRDLPFRGRLSSGERQARYGGHRSRPDAAQEHRKIDPGLFAASGRPRPSETCDRGQASAKRPTEKAFVARARSPPGSSRWSY